MNAVSLELAHICAGMPAGGEPERSLLAYRAWVRAHRADSHHQCLVLVDDTVGPIPMSPDKLEALYRRLPTGAAVVLESLLAPQAIQLGSQIHHRAVRDGRRVLHSDETATVFRSDGAPACALLAAAWYLVRLGRLPPPPSLFGSAVLPAAKLVCFLDYTLMNTEHRVDRVLSAAGHGAVIPAIRRNWLSDPDAAVAA